MKNEEIAKVCHEANRAYCATLGDFSQPAWEEAPDWQRSSAVHGVEFHRSNPGASPSASHETWYAEKEAAGWVYGEVKDPEKKQHPCMVPFDQLPIEQQRKDKLFSAIAAALFGLLLMVGAGQAHAGWGDSLDALFADIPVQGEAEELGEDFGDDWFEAGDFTLEPDEPVVLVAPRAVAALEEPAPGPVLELEPFVRLYLNSTPAQRSKAMGLALKTMLKGKQYAGRRDQVRDCAVNSAEIVASDVVVAFLFGREVATADQAADALVTGIGVCLGESARGSQVIAAFVEAIAASLARPQ